MKQKKEEEEETIVIDIKEGEMLLYTLRGMHEEATFLELCENLEVKVDKKKYPDSIFLFSGDKYFFEIQKSTIWCSHNNVWNIFYNRFFMSYDGIQLLIKKMVKQHFKKCFKLKTITPRSKYLNGDQSVVEEHFKLKDLTIKHFISRWRDHEVEIHFKTNSKNEIQTS